MDCWPGRFASLFSLALEHVGSRSGYVPVLQTGELTHAGCRHSAEHNSLVQACQLVLLATVSAYLVEKLRGSASMQLGSMELELLEFRHRLPQDHEAIGSASFPFPSPSYPLQVFYVMILANIQKMGLA